MVTHHDYKGPVQMNEKGVDALRCRDTFLKVGGVMKECLIGPESVKARIIEGGQER